MHLSLFLLCLMYLPLGLRLSSRVTPVTVCPLVLCCFFFSRSAVAVCLCVCCFTSTPPSRACAPMIGSKWADVQNINIPRSCGIFTRYRCWHIAAYLPACLQTGSAGGMAPQRPGPRDGMHGLQMPGCVGGSGRGTCLIVRARCAPRAVCLILFFRESGLTLEMKTSVPKNGVVSRSTAVVLVCWLLLAHRTGVC